MIIQKLPKKERVVATRSSHQRKLAFGTSANGSIIIIMFIRLYRQNLNFVNSSESQKQVNFVEKYSRHESLAKGDLEASLFI